MPEGLFLHPVLSDAESDAAELPEPVTHVEAEIVVYSPGWFWEMAKPVRTVAKI